MFRRTSSSYFANGAVSAFHTRDAPSRHRCSKAVVAALVLTGLVSATPAAAETWRARTLEGTPAERSNTTTPPHPSKDQCSLKAPDASGSLFDFSMACYAHDVCYQNHQLNGRRRGRADCDAILRAKMTAECTSRHGRFNPRRLECLGYVPFYWTAVRAAGDLPGISSWDSWRGRQCLDVSGGGGDGAAVIQYRCNWGQNQRFSVPDIDATGEIRPLHTSGKCLDVPGASRAAGARLILYTCNGGANQRFTRTRSGELRAQHSGMCVDVSGASQDDGAAIIQYSCNGGANQRFRSTARGELRPEHR